MKQKIIALIVGIALALGLSLTVGAGPAAAGDVTAVTHSPNSERAGLYIKIQWSYSGSYDFRTLTQDDTYSGFTGNGWWPTDFYVPSGYCARVSKYGASGYINTVYYGSGWSGTHWGYQDRVALYAC